MARVVYASSLFVWRLLMDRGLARKASPRGLAPVYVHVHSSGAPLLALSSSRQLRRAPPDRRHLFRECMIHDLR